MADEPRTIILADNEIEGEYDVNEDVIFKRLGDPVPLLSSDSDFDLKSPPRRPLAISERFRTLFLAHSQGFFVATTKDVIEAAKDIKEKRKGKSIQDLCVVDVKIGRVSILALSNDSSVLAAVVGGDISFFYVPSLIDKEPNPSFSHSLKNSSYVKDFRWQKNAQKSFLIVSNDGLLYCGRTKEQLQDLMENVDAVDWSLNGDYIAVATKNTLRIFSSDFKELLCLSLSFQLWSTETETENSIKVDTIEWVRDDSLIVGCVRLTQDGGEEGYMIQVITSNDHKFTQSSIEPVVFSFPDIFENILDDIIPSGAGPYLLFSYLDSWELLIVSNKKNIDQHILLLKYLVGDDKKEVVFHEFNDDKYRPTIALKESGDDNVILGFGIDKTAVYERVTVQVGTEFKELSPQGVLFCLTCEGRLLMYHLARFSDSSDLPQYSLPPVDLSTESELSAATSRVRDDQDDFVPSNNVKQMSEIPKVLTGQEFEGKAVESLVTEPEKASEFVLETSHLQPSTSSNKLGSSLQNLNASPLSSAITNSIVGKMSSEANLTQQASSKSYLRISDPVNMINRPESDDEPSSFSTRNCNVSSSGSETINIAFVGKTSSEAASTRQSSSEDCSMTNNAGNINVMPEASQQSSFSLQPGGMHFGSDGFASKPSLFSSGGLVGGGARENSEARFGNKQDISQSAKPSTVTTFDSNSSNRESSSLLFSASQSTINEGVSNSEPSKANPGSLFPLRSSAMGKSPFSMPQSDSDYNRTSKSHQTLNIESESITQPYTVKDIIKELDFLLLPIEQQEGFRDSCIALQQNSLLTIEEGLKSLSEMTRKSRINIDEQLLEIEELQRKMLQVSARQVYMEGILKQASNKQYWDIWNQQRLSPEFEQKRQTIWKANQDLTNQLIQLERHFNALEINRHGEASRSYAARGATYGSFGQSKYNRRASDNKQQIQPLHSVYKTLNSQLTAAEQLSECLTKQLSLLNICPLPKKRTGITRELFESIGLVHEDNSLQSPIVTSPDFTPRSRRILSPLTVSDSKDRHKIMTSNVRKGSEPDTTRRRRDYLSGAQATFEPKKTTVRRMAQQGVVRADSGSPFRRAKAAFDSQIDSLTRIQQKASSAMVSSSKETITGKFQSEQSFTSSNMAKPSKQVSGSSPASLFKWANAGPGLEPHHVLDLQKSPKQTEKTGTLVQPVSLPMQSYIKDKSGLFHMGNSTITSSSAGSSVSLPKTTLAMQTQSDSSYTNPNLFSGTSTVQMQPMLQSKTQHIRQLDPDIAKDGLDNTTRGIAKSAPVSSTDAPQLSYDSNFAPFSLGSSAPSSIQSVKASTVTTKEHNSGPISALNSDSKASNPSPLSAFSTSSVDYSSGLSTSNFSSVASSSFSTMVAGFSSSSASKTATELKASSTVLPPMPASSGQHLLSPSQAQASGSTTGLLNSGNVLSGSLLNDVESRSEPSLQQASENKVSTTSEFDPAATSSKEHSVKEFAKVTSEQALGHPASSAIIIPAASDSQSKINPTATTTYKVVESSEGLDINLSSQEDEMEEEIPDSSNVLDLGALDGFGLGSAPPSSNTKSNPFGASFGTSNIPVSSSPVLTAPPGQLFRPPSFIIPSAQSTQPSLSVSSNTFSGGNSGGFAGFGQPAQVAPGQQALGSVLGAFGQSRQLGLSGFGAPTIPTSGGFGSSGGFAAAATGGGFTSFASKASGFAGAGTGGGFAVATTGGVFANAPSGGGFAAVASQGSGFGAAPQGSGFGAALPQVGGFSAAASQGSGFGAGGGFAGGGFGGFTSSTGGAFSQFGANSAPGAGRPPAELLTQMRK